MIMAVLEKIPVSQYESIQDAGAPAVPTSAPSVSVSSINDSDED